MFNFCNTGINKVKTDPRRGSTEIVIQQSLQLVFLIPFRRRIRKTPLALRDRREICVYKYCNGLTSVTNKIITLSFQAEPGTILSYRHLFQQFC